MNKSTSLYLDIVRFSAAVVVMLGHVQAFNRSHGPFRFIMPEGQAAVSAFFVLSGFVIAHVIATRERSFAEFAASRLGRLYSVVLPALLLTFCCDALGTAKEPSFYGFLKFDHPGWRYLATGLFLNESWLSYVSHSLAPGSNLVFWSLSLEAIYYAAIAILVFARGPWRIGATILLCLIAGPGPVLMAPLWFLGYGLYRWRPQFRLRTSRAIVLWLLSVSVCAASYKLQAIDFGGHLPILVPGLFAFLGHRLGFILCRYVSAAAFACSIVVFRAASAAADPVLSRLQAPIRWLSSLTFALYLFHVPIVMLLSVYRIAPIGSFVQYIWVIGIVFAFVATVGRMCEKSKGFYKFAFLKLISARAPAPKIVN